jgi:hypothetical protein
MRSLPEARVLTDHSIERFRQRHGNRQTPVRVVIQVLAAGRFQHHRPPTVGLARTGDERPYGYIVNAGVVFPVQLKIEDGCRKLVAVSCLKVRKRPKAERRALREMAREEDAWAA